LQEVAELGITPEFGKSLIFRWQASPNSKASPGYVDSSGKVWSTGAWDTANRLGDASAGERYLDAVAAAVGGKVKRYPNSSPEVMGPDGKGVDAAALVDAGQQWKAAISRLISETRALQE
jgi:hypothetical protein